MGNIVKTDGVVTDGADFSGKGFGISGDFSKLLPADFRGITKRVEGYFRPVYPPFW